MPDITMCNNQQCERRNSCYRFIAKPPEYMQSYFLIEDRKLFAEDCRHYWEVKANV